MKGNNGSVSASEEKQLGGAINRSYMSDRPPDWFQSWSSSLETQIQRALALAASSGGNGSSGNMNLNGADRISQPELSRLVRVLFIFGCCLTSLLLCYLSVLLE